MADLKVDLKADMKEDAYSNRASLTAARQYFGYPANPVLFLFAVSILVGVQLRSLLFFGAAAALSALFLNLVCRNDPNGIAVWLLAGKRRLFKRVTCLSADVVAERPFMFTE